MSCFLFLPWTPIWAGSPGKLVKKGNAAYARGKYDDALAAYEEATVEVPESPYIHFNKGAAFYRKGDYAKATDLFENAALKSRDTKLEARSKFNLGNCSFREAERQKDSNSKKSLASCEQSVRHYQQALELDPELREAAENIEVVRLIMKSILDEIKKQEETAKKQQEAQRKAAEKLKELIERQQKATDRNKALSKERQQNGDSENVRDQVGDLANDQKELGKETSELAANMPQPQQSPSPVDQVRQHLENAGKEQKSAASKLEQNDLQKARPSQEKAVEELKKALEAMSGGGKNQKGRDQQEQQQEQQAQAPQEQPREGEQDNEEEQEAMAQLPDEARDILDEEKENKEQRRQVRAGGYRAVDKDW